MASTLKVQNIQHTGGTAAIAVDSSGRITNPNVPYIFADLHNGSSAGYDSHSNQTPVEFRNVISSRGGFSLNTGTHTFTVPVTGIYQINFSLLISGSGSNIDFSIGPSQGNEVYRTYSYDARSTHAAIAIPFTAGDTFQLRNSSGSSVSIHRNTDATDRYTHLSAYLIG